MPEQQHPPTTPSPKSGRTGKITDFFKSVHQSEAKQPTKRDLEFNDQKDGQPAKRLKQGDNGHATSIITARYNVNVDTPEPKTRKPASARLLDDTDGGLQESLVGRRGFLEETSAEDVGPAQGAHLKSSRPIHTPARVNNPKRKRPASSRLLDDTDGGLMDSLVGRFETPRLEEDISEDGEEKRNDEPRHGAVDNNTMDDNTVGNDTVDEDTEAETIKDDDSEAETIKACDSEDGISSDENRDDEDSEEYSSEGEDSEGEDSDKENVDPRDRYRTPSLPPLPATPGHHENQSHDTTESTPSNQPSASPSSLLLPSPVVDLPPLPSSPSSSSTLVPEHPSTLPSPPSSP